MDVSKLLLKGEGIEGLKKRMSSPEEMLKVLREARENLDRAIAQLEKVVEARKCKSARS